MATQTRKLAQSKSKKKEKRADGIAADIMTWVLPILALVISIPIGAYGYNLFFGNTIEQEMSFSPSTPLLVEPETVQQHLKQTFFGGNIELAEGTITPNAQHWLLTMDERTSTADVFFYPSAEAMAADRSMYSTFVDQGYAIITYHSVAVVYAPFDFGNVPIQQAFTTIPIVDVN